MIRRASRSSVSRIAYRVERLHHDDEIARAKLPIDEAGRRLARAIGAGRP